ncbi:hypothetical protein V2J09_009655 [Rumex salicifolius]
MSIKLHHQSFLSPSSSAQRLAEKSKAQYLGKVFDLDHVIFGCVNTRKSTLIKCKEFKSCQDSHSSRAFSFRWQNLVPHTRKWTGSVLPFASADDGIAVNGSPSASTSSSVEAMRVRLDQSLQNENYNDGLVQALHDAARVFELSFKEQISTKKIGWFTAVWLGIDHDAWMKALSYQASVYSLIQAANEVASNGDRQDKDISIAVQRSLLRLSAPLESIVREKLSSKQSELLEWFWSEQVPVVVRTFVSHFERDPRFKATTVSGKRTLSAQGNDSDGSLVMLSLICIAAITKLGPAKVSCSQCLSMIPDISGKLLDILVELIPIREAYHSAKDIGLDREFLVHFGPRAATAGMTGDCGTDEVVFWVDLVQKQLQQAIDREKIWSRLTTSESIEVLERDLAIFGFFITLGRSTQSFLAANGFDNLDEPMKGFIRYLIGGSVLYYPQLSSISSYQLYVEVVCEELDWLTFYPGYANTLKQSHGHKKSEAPCNAEALTKALDVSSYWIKSFIKHSKWLENPPHVKAAHFLSRGHRILKECMEEVIILKDLSVNANFISTSQQWGLSVPDSLSEENPDSFKMALESVEESVVKLETLLQELHVRSSSSEKENLKAACSELERIRKLKKEAEFLEASFRAKAASLHEVNDDKKLQSSPETRRYILGKNKRASDKPNGIWNLLVRPPMKKSERDLPDTPENIDKGTSSLGDSGLDSNEFQRFELLRSELIELEKRVQQSATRSENGEGIKVYGDEAGRTGLVTVKKSDSIIEKSFTKLKETSTDVLQGTQLLAVDTAAAMGLLRRSIIGDELTEKEKKALRRTLTDLASVVPIGILMLLPVTAVGHAAMLACIQRYVPSLIPSTYGPERLDLLRQLEKVKEMETLDTELDPNQVEELT